MILLLVSLACAGAPRSLTPSPVTAPAAPAPRAADTVARAFPPPSGATRVPADAFGTWLQAMHVAAPDVPVKTWDGRVVPVHARVIDLPLVPGDLQQCADSAIRVRAEWLRQTGAPDISFHATSGDPIPWSKWQQGERPYDEGGHIAWKPGTKGGWDAYLSKVFTWAGTRSLGYDTAPDATPRPGDLLVDPGSPGHAVVILDVAVLGDQTWLLVAQGFMPAQSFHVPFGPEQGWWPWDDGLRLPWWTFSANQLRRWKP